MNTKLLKKLIYGFAVVAIAAVAAWNLNVSSKRYDLIDISLANIEALAGAETDCSDCPYRKYPCNHGGGTQCTPPNGLTGEACGYNLFANYLKNTRI